jgi:hypothetical protein
MLVFAFTDQYTLLFATATRDDRPWLGFITSQEAFCLLKTFFSVE